MMDKEKLRRADIFSGAVIALFGLWVVAQAVKMPMKGSWGGVQNVWFVSPALFPLLVGAMIALLGILLMRTALVSVGRHGLSHVLNWLLSRKLFTYLVTPAVMRFYAVVILFFTYVFLSIPRIDFFLCSVLFLVAFITMFYFDDDALLKKLLTFYIAIAAVTIVFFATGLSSGLESRVDYPGDWLTLCAIAAYCAYAWLQAHSDRALRKKYRTALILAVAAPFIIGPVFKYLLLVPMPTEGLVVSVMDAIWYWDF